MDIYLDFLESSIEQQFQFDDNNRTLNLKYTII